MVSASGLCGCKSNDKPAVGSITRGGKTVTRSVPRSDVPAKKPKPRTPPKDQGEVVRRVRCLYDEKPWLNLDARGDRDPEGLMVRVFLDTGNGYGVHRDGTFHVDMYKITQQGPEKFDRTLSSDWHYPSSEVHTIKTPGMLGQGYMMHLMWANKELAGSEVEFVIRFEGADGHIARSATKRLRVPKYST